jgi:hypothetical protein
MKVDMNEAKKHMANKSLWHHFKGKAIEVGLYALADAVKLNEPAPRDLPIWEIGGEEVSLNTVLQSYQDKEKMVILNIGSFTCPVWRERQHKVQALSKLYSNSVVCITIYVREAHASDEWMLDMNEKANISYPKPTSLEERTLIAKRSINELMDKDAIVYIDGVKNNAVNRAYRAVPIRICVIDTNGLLVFRTEEHGPFGYEPEKLALFLEGSFGEVQGTKNILSST